MDIDEAGAACDAVLDAVGAAVVADDRFLDRVLLGCLARGHVLLEDVPGTGKTLTARGFAAALGLSFSRVQFTPDLLPADVTGTNVFDESDRTFEFSEGPIFANVVLADEINRAPPKTQAAMLEAMEEEQVTVDGETHELPTPFFVIATQNPVEQEGSLHPDESVYMNGSLWRAGDALEYAKTEGQLVVETEDTRLYDVDAETQTLAPTGDVRRQSCLVYETDYVGDLYTVRTKTGREIRVSGNHPFLVNRGGDVTWRTADELESDDSLVTPDELRAPDRPLPTHDEALEVLADDERMDVVRRERVERIQEARQSGERLDRAEVDDLRIAAGLSKTELAERTTASYDQVLNYLEGAETDRGGDLAGAISGEEVTVGDAVESFTRQQFETPLTDAEAGFFVGFVLSDGDFSDSSVRIYQKNYPDRFDRWVELAEKLGFTPRIREMKGGREAAIDSVALVEYLDARYSIRSPSNLLSAPKTFRRAFLDVFLLVESHFDLDRRRVTFTQVDRETTNLIAHLLLQFGVRPWIANRDRVYRLKIQGEDLARYCDLFTWPGEEPDVDEFDSVHRSVPVDLDRMEALVEKLGVHYAGDMADRDWYNSLKNLRDGRPRIQTDKLAAFVDDMTGTLANRETKAPTSIAEDVGAAARECGIAMTDVVEATGETKHRIWQAYDGGSVPESAVEYVAAERDRRLDDASLLLSHFQRFLESDVFHDPIDEIRHEPYEGTVVGLSVPETHNYVAGLGACGINHNTFPLPEAQIDRFAVKTAIGYPDRDGEIEILRRRAGRVEQSPSVDSVLDADSVTELRRAPEEVRVDDDVIDYIADLTRATREDNRVDVGVSPRGTQRLFEAARAQAVLRQRGFVTPEDVKDIAPELLAHRLVLTPDAKVNDIAKQDIVDDVLQRVEVPTVG